MNTENSNQRSKTSQQLPEIKVLPSVETKDERENYQEYYPQEEFLVDSQPFAPRSKKFPWLVAILLSGLVLGGGGWFAYSRLQQQKAAPTTPGAPMAQGGPNQGPQAMPVRLGKARGTTIEDSSEYVARLESRQAVRPKPQVSGQITKIFVRAGDRVTGGAPIMQINPVEQQASLESQLAAVESARAELRLAQADVTNAKQTLESRKAEKRSVLSNLAFQQQEFQRFSQLQGQGAVTRQALDQRRLDLQKAQADVAEIDAQIRAQEAAIAKAEANIAKQDRLIQQQRAGATQERVRLNFYSINAPFSGNIGDIPVKVGDYVSPTTELYTIADNQTLQIQVRVPVEKAPQLRNGMPVQLVDDQGKPRQTGQISFIAPNIDPQTQSVLAKASFDNSNGTLRTDQFVRARVIWETRPGVAVPKVAIKGLAGQDFVFVAERKAEPGKEPMMVASQRPVKLGKIIGNDQEILEGLKPGEEIVVSGLMMLRDGIPIMPETQAPGAGGAPTGAPAAGSASQGKQDSNEKSN